MHCPRVSPCQQPLVGILMGSDSDWPKIKAAAAALEEFDVPYEVRVMSAHRTPDLVQQYASTAAARGLKVIIAAAGGAAHLAGVVAAHTMLPVIGIPVPTELQGGLDSLLSMVQMPGDVPVATVGVGGGGARNAGLLAVQILALADPALAREATRPSSADWWRRSWPRTPPCRRRSNVNKSGEMRNSPESRQVEDLSVLSKKTETLHWIGGPDGHLRMIDQTRLPVEFVEIDCRDVETVWEAIKMLRVRGAPAIGIAAAYGVCLGLQTAAGQDEAALLPALGTGRRLPGHQPADGRESVLGPGSHESGRRQASRPAGRRKSPPACLQRPGRSTRKTGRCAGPSAGTGRSCCPTARAC